jgi:hypothetical protein
MRGGAHTGEQHQELNAKVPKFPIENEELTIKSKMARYAVGWALPKSRKTIRAEVALYPPL